MNKTNRVTAIVASGTALAASGLIVAAPSVTATVDSVDYPVCSVEDCSDRPESVGLWQDPDTGNWWLSTGARSYPVQSDR